MASCDDNGPPSAKPADVDVALKKDGGDDTNGQSLPRSVSRSESRRPSRFSNVSNASTVNSSREGPQWSPSAAAADSVKRLDRTKSWGTRQAERLALESSDKDRGRDKDAVHVPLFSKLGYVLHFGEPIPEENLHLDDEAWVKKLLAKDHWWVIHPFSTFRRSWDFFLVALLLYVALMVPFVIGFEVDTDEGTALFVIDRFVDVFFMLDIIFNFFTGFTTAGKVIMEPKNIVISYLRSWFLLDLVASIPFDLIFLEPEGERTAQTSSSATGKNQNQQAAYRSTKFVRIMKLIRLLKLFRMLRLNRILNRLERKMSIKYGLWQVIKFTFAVMCLAHWQACAWYLMHVLQDKGHSGSTWVELLAYNQNSAPLDMQPRWTQYVTCIYWSVTTMTTIGYGDIVPSNTEERIVTLLAELCGASIFLYGLTQVTNLIANINTADVEFHKLMDQANEYFEFRQIPQALRVKVREFFHYKRASSLFHAEHRLLDHVSDSIRQEMQLWSIRNVMNNTPFLRDANESFVKLIVGKLVRKVFSPREVVMQQGEIGDEMFFIAHGEVEVIAGGHRVAFLGEGAMIGEIAMAMKTRRTATVRTVTFTELLSLSRRVFQNAARIVPETAEAMVGYAVRRLRIALWKRVKQKVCLIKCANAFRKAAGLPTFGEAMAEQSTRSGFSRRLRSVASFGSLLALSRTGSEAADASQAKGTAVDTNRGNPSEFSNPFSSALDYFYMGMDSVQTPYPEEDATSGRINGKYIKEEVRHASSVLSIAAFATQQMLARIDEAAGRGDDEASGTSYIAECDTAADELQAMLQHLAGGLAQASERIQTCRRRHARRSLPGNEL